MRCQESSYLCGEGMVLTGKGSISAFCSDGSILYLDLNDAVCMYRCILIEMYQSLLFKIGAIY